MPPATMEPAGIPGQRCFQPIEREWRPVHPPPDLRHAITPPVAHDSIGIFGIGGNMNIRNNLRRVVTTAVTVAAIGVGATGRGVGQHRPASGGHVGVPPGQHPRQRPSRRSPSSAGTAGAGARTSAGTWAGTGSRARSPAGNGAGTTAGGPGLVLAGTANKRRSRSPGRAHLEACAGLRADMGLNTRAQLRPPGEGSIHRRTRGRVSPQAPGYAARSSPVPRTVPRSCPTRRADRVLLQHRGLLVEHPELSLHRGD